MKPRRNKYFIEFGEEVYLFVKTDIIYCVVNTLKKEKSSLFHLRGKA